MCGFLHAVSTLTRRMSHYVHYTINIMAPRACLEVMRKKISVLGGSQTPVFKPITVYLLTDRPIESYIVVFQSVWLSQKNSRINLPNKHSHRYWKCEISLYTYSWFNSKAMFHAFALVFSHATLQNMRVVQECRRKSWFQRNVCWSIQWHSICTKMPFREAAAASWNEAEHNRGDMLKMIRCARCFHRSCCFPFEM